MGVIVKAIEGMAEACRALDFPVVSGNVSLYNETDGVGIPPTPVVGGIGLIEDLDKIATLRGAKTGDTLAIVGFGKTSGHLGASLYARVILGLDGMAAGSPPPVDLAHEKRMGAFVRSLVRDGIVTAVHDVSDGGAVVAAAEMALATGLGVSFTFQTDFNDAEDMFGEAQGLYLVAFPDGSADRFERAVEATGVQYLMLAEFGGEAIRGITSSGKKVDVPLSKLRAAHEGWLPAYMKGPG
jgi:phosphoribosylformylglycinamidine synthase